MISYERLFESSDVQVVCCQVRPDLEQFLTIEESYSMSACTSEVRNRAAAARLAARELLSQAGFPEWNLPRKHGDAPDWPPDWTGSLSHSDDFAAAALARCEDIASIGIDIEPAEPLPRELRDTVIVSGDVCLNESSDIAGRILFCAKEASYKAVYPVDRQFLEFADVTVNLDAGFAETCYGRRLSLSVHVDHRIVVLAHLAKDNP
jgi:4'-phosphopantetheinyl transferase EntD